MFGSLEEPQRLKPGLPPLAAMRPDVEKTVKGTVDFADWLQIKGVLAHADWFGQRLVRRALVARSVLRSPFSVLRGGASRPFRDPIVVRGQPL